MFEIKTYNAIDPAGIKRLKDAGNTVDTGIAPDAILIRSQNMHETEIPSSLLAIGRAGAGVNNIPIDACAKNGIVVFNTPGANANAVKELVFANLFMAARPIVEGINWVRTLPIDTPDIEGVIESEKKRFGGTELIGKTLGVVGLGAIGAMVANDAYRLGMDVLGYDPYVSVDTAWTISSRVKRVHDLTELLKNADYITIHIPLVAETKHLIDETTLRAIKKNAVLLNFSRGELVDNSAVLESLANGNLGRYITDFVAPELLAHDKISILPHLGASTTEAEVNCAKMAARTLNYFLETGNIKRSVNFPTVELGLQSALRFSIIHCNVPNMLGIMSTELAKHNINIINMLNRSRGDFAYTLIDMDDITPENLEALLQTLNAVEAIIRIRVIKAQA